MARRNEQEPDGYRIELIELTADARATSGDS